MFVQQKSRMNIENSTDNDFHKHHYLKLDLILYP